ncbi:hypothetical protein [Micromonospora sp. HUAS LYJ1]|uniref:hypothetical protein n=1 Tax=Micromonospora sp. HUAS LYJ1 TaxID=3061626 RepID=UPI002671BC75|nr:hypothetical protein [Micromonospora sp. HUAS LYJ1]WKU08046.1 hypothetical protein Q2K16_13950 [Micromonospora sp. HUAS LYJ1]
MSSRCRSCPVIACRPGRRVDLVDVGRAAGVQFVRPIRCRVVRVLDWITYDGWCWLDVYQLDAREDAAVRRSIFVRPAGLAMVRPAPVPRAPSRAGVTPNMRQGSRPAGVPPAVGGRGAAGRG